MPDIKLTSEVRTKIPYFTTTSVNWLASQFIPPTYVGLAATIVAHQTNPWDVYAFTSSMNYQCMTLLQPVSVGARLAFHQSNPWLHFLLATSMNEQMAKPSGFAEALSRIIVNISDPSIRANEQTKMQSTLTYAHRLHAESQKAYGWIAGGEQTDNLLSINWRGPTTGDDHYIFIEYAGEDNKWHDILDSLSIIVSPSGEQYVMPKFSWNTVDPEDLGETISYELTIAYDFYMKNKVLTVETSGTEYTLSYAQRLQTGLSYYWSVKAKDSYGSYSAAAPVKAFTTYDAYPEFVGVIPSENKIRVLVPFEDFQYSWFVGNLYDGVYRYRIFEYDANTNSVQQITDQLLNPSFIIDHTIGNPPEILNLRYDAPTYALHFDIKITDSLFRRYKITGLYYADERDKALSGAGASYWFDNYDWHQIPLGQVRGKTSDMESNPVLDSNAVFVWSNQGVKHPEKKYTYDLQVANDRVMEQKSFKYAYRMYDAEGNPAPWTTGDFDYSDGEYWAKRLTFGTRLADQVYYGKANPSGIIMNKTRFNFPSGSLAYDFRLFFTDINDPIIEKATAQNYVVLTPKELYDAGITNVVLDLKGITSEHYELYPLEIEKIIEQIGHMDFYWRVRTYDGVEYSAWSGSRQNEDFNVHHLSWNVTNDSDFLSSDFYIIRADVVPESTDTYFELPKFAFIPNPNSEINQIYQRIDSLTKNINDGMYDSTLTTYYTNYIRYLKNRVLAIRQAAFNYMLSSGGLTDPAAYFAVNVHDRPVMDGGARTSDLDFGFNDIDNEKEIVDAGGGFWSTVLYKWRMDSATAFNSQDGAPLRQISAIGRACQNETYQKCYLQTHDTSTCPLYGILCPGLVMGDRPTGQDARTVPQSEIPPNWGQQGDITLPEIHDDDSDIYFDQGSCPMANGGPCIQFGKTFKNLQEKACDVCDQPRYLQYLSHASEVTGLEYAVNSDIYPAGFASVTITDANQNEVQPWQASTDTAQGKRIEPQIAFAGQIRNPHKHFLNLMLERSQLPGELNSDVLDKDNTEPIDNAFFNEELKGERKVFDDLTTDLTTGWWKQPRHPYNDVDLVERF